MDYILLRTNFWSDDYVIELSADEKLLYIYLCSNPRMNQIGIFSISLKTICFETGLELAEVKPILEKLEKDNKIMAENNYIWVTNALKNHPNTNPRVLEIIKKEVAEHESRIKAPKIIKAFLEYYKDIIIKAKGKESKEEKRVKIDKEEDKKLHKKEEEISRPQKVDIKSLPAYTEILRRKVKREITEAEKDRLIKELEEKYK